MGFFKSLSIRSSDERIEASQFSMEMFERETSAQIVAGLTCTKCWCEAAISGSSVQSLQKTSLAAETTGGEIVVAFWLKHDHRSNLRVSNFKNFPGRVEKETLVLTVWYKTLHWEVGRLFEVPADII